ncbi:MAG: sigma-70 family RNA polymerase sigma factor [Oscillospiraceae bacterium]|nr:sigma-70 family RNA polymerase sigma factor [Oscillospiraceae bacterium]
MEDFEIINLFWNRSEQAITELDLKYGHAVKKTAANLLRNQLDVEECVNDTYLGAWNTIPPQKPNPLVSYVCRIARNLAVKKYETNTASKRDSRYDATLDELAECIPATIDVEAEYAAKELSAAISRFLDTLCYEDRFCFVRRYWFADSISDIAAATHRKDHFVSVRLSRVREKLLHYLKKEGFVE